MRTAIDPGEPVQYGELFAGGRVRRVYLDELGETADRSVGAGMIQLIVESSETAGERARGLIQQAQQELTDEALRRKVVELIDIINGCDGIVERRDKPLSLQEFCNKDATGLDMRRYWFTSLPT